LEARHHEPLLAQTSGTIRFDLRDGGDIEHWFVTVDKGDIAVSGDDGDADLILGLDSALFEGMTEGKFNTMAAFLRGQVLVVGDLALAMAFQRVFPGPPDAVGPNTPLHRVEATR
jgi:putative sterol carrier protein